MKNDPLIPELYAPYFLRLLMQRTFFQRYFLGERVKRSWKKRLFARPWRPFKTHEYKEIPTTNITNDRFAGQLMSRQICPHCWTRDQYYLPLTGYEYCSICQKRMFKICKCGEINHYTVVRCKCGERYD